MEAVELELDQPVESLSDITWSNADNKEFYENFSYDEYQKYLSLAGLSSNPDINLIHDYIISAASILDVGPGYGRVFEAAKKMEYKGKLTGVEFSRPLVGYLKSKYQNYKVIEENFLKYKSSEKYDLILMMWTTISVFSPVKEQEECFEQCSYLMNDTGFCVIDLLLSNTLDEAISHGSKEYITASPSTNITHYGYIPSILELIRYAAKAGLAIRKILEYKAGTAERCLVIFGKS
jgi:SAM-dependent methyltransferase